MIRNEATISGIVNDTMPSNNYTNIWVKYTGSTMMSGWIGSGMM